MNREPTLLKAANNFLASQIGRSSNTKRLYRYILSKFVSQVKKPVNSLTAHDILIYLTTLETTVSKNTLRAHMIVLKAWFKSLGRNDIVDQIKPIKEAKTPPVALNQEAIHQMVEAATKPRDKLIILLLSKTGIRVSELLAMKCEDIDFNEGVIRIIGKGEKTRFVLINLQTLELLKKYLQDRIRGVVIDLSASYIRQIVKKSARKAGLENWEKIHPHLLRHAFAINWIQSGGDIEGLRRLLGHESLETSKIYLDYDFSHVKDTYRKIFGSETRSALSKGEDR